LDHICSLLTRKEYVSGRLSVAIQSWDAHQDKQHMFTQIYKRPNKPEKSSGELLKAVKHIEEHLNRTARTFSAQVLFVSFDSYLQLTQSICQNVLKFRTKVLAQSSLTPIEREREIFADFRYLHHKFVKEVLPITAQYLKTGVADYMNELSDLYKEAPLSMKHYHDNEELHIADDEAFRIGTLKKWKTYLQSAGVAPVTIVRYKTLLRHFIGYVYVHQFHNYLKALAPAFGDIIDSINRNLEDDLQSLRRLTRGETLDNFTIERIEARYQEISQQIKETQDYFRDYLIEYNARFRHEIFDIAFRVNANYLISKEIQKEISSDVSFELAKFGRTWYNHQVIFHNYITATLELLRIRTEYKNLTSQIKKEINSRFFDESVEVVRKIQSGIEEIRYYHRAKDVQKLKEYVFDTDDILIFTDDAITSAALSDFQELAETLPKNLALLEENYAEAFQNDLRQKPKCIKVNFSISMEYLIENRLISPIDRELQSLPIKFKKINDHIQHFTQLILLGLSNYTQTRNADDNLIQALKDAQNGLRLAEDKLEELRRETERAIERFLNETLDAFEPHQFVQEVVHSEHWRNENDPQGIRKIANSQVQRFEKIKEEGRKILGKTQEDILIAEFQQKHKQYENVYGSLRNFVHQVTPNEEIIENVPFYYRQLFTGKQLTNTTIIRNRERELKMMAEATEQLKKRSGGAILVTGEILSGKSLFCEKSAHDFFQGKVFRINPPIGGSTKVAEFIRLFREQTKTRYKGTIMDTLPQGSVLIFNDLELWWERNLVNGTAVLNRIGRMIDKYGKDYFFILNCNIHTLNFLTRVPEWYEKLITTIHLSPFSFDKLRQTILARHYSGGLHFSYDNYSENELPQNRSDKLFRRILDISEGNIGMALQLWISNISDIQGEQLVLTEPITKKMPTLTDADKLLLISQFVFHKHISFAKLARIYPYGKTDRLKETILGLVRSGILQEVGKEVFVLNPYIIPYLLKQLRKAQLI